MGYKKYLTTGNTEDGLTKVILKTIEEAQHYIKLSSFLMQDYGIIEAHPTNPVGRMYGC